MKALHSLTFNESSNYKFLKTFIKYFSKFSFATIIFLPQIINFIFQLSTNIFANQHQKVLQEPTEDLPSIPDGDIYLTSNNSCRFQPELKIFF